MVNCESATTLTINFLIFEVKKKRVWDQMVYLLAERYMNRKIDKICGMRWENGLMIVLFFLKKVKNLSQCMDNMLVLS